MAKAVIHTLTEEKTSAAATPMMEQYLGVKGQYPDCLLFYRMGDFYEMFFDDAVTTAEVLDIALTKRGKHGEDDIPMCGVPYHSYEPYLQKLIRSGYKVAICEQMESPEEAKKRGYKAVVRRDVVRIVTPGTLTEDNLLEAREANYLAALAGSTRQLALAWVDISTGICHTSATDERNLASDLARLSPKELLLPDSLYEEQGLKAILRECGAALTPYANNIFEATRGEIRIKECFSVASLDGFGQFSKAEIGACGALIEYLDLTQKGTLPRLNPPKPLRSEHYLAIDASTRRNLELFLTLSGERKGSLLNILDITITGAGARLLSSYLAAPLAEAEAIRQRLDRVEYFYNQQNLREDIRLLLKRVPDMERALSRLCVGRGGPRDLTALRDGMGAALEISALFEGLDVPPSDISNSLKYLGGLDDVLVELQKALKPEVGHLARDGGFIAEGYHPKLDELRDLRDNGRQSLLSLQERYRRETSINTLKVNQNNVLGYFIEVTPQHSGKMADSRFIHRQTLANAVRYTTEELRLLEEKIVSARDQALRLESELFELLARKIQAEGKAISEMASALAKLDVSAALAELAIRRNYTRPQMENSTVFTIKNGRHPVVEANIGQVLEGDFIANSCDLSDNQRLWLLTGPNMAGKSTFLRQNAVIALMAQMGSFVPAEAAHIGVVDRLFSRVGASDDLARGRSTFMVEMVETASILNQATPRSLVILDEIGRGTATYDGLSIAWAVVEHLHNTNHCRSLFATHYHELTTLAESLPALVCYTMKVKEWQGEVVFLHEVMKGAADRSYGIHVASLAGLPKAVIKRANQVLSALQQGEGGRNLTALADALPLFMHAESRKEPKALQEEALAADALHERLSAVQPDSLSPREALEILYQLKELAENI